MRHASRIFLVAALGAASSAQALVGLSQTGGPLEPHAVMLLKTTGGASGFCTGIVVSARAILTAAHCVTGAANMRVHYRDAAGAPVLKPVSAVAVPVTEDVSPETPAVALADGGVLASGDSVIEAAASADALGISPAEYLLEPIPAEDTLLM